MSSPEPFASSPPTLGGIGLGLRWDFLEEVVDEGNDRVQNAGFTRGFGHCSLRPRMGASVRLEPEFAVEDVASDVGGAACEGRGQRQRKCSHISSHGHLDTRSPRFKN